MMLDDIATYLATSTTFTVGATGNLTKTFMPETGQLATLFETPGSGSMFEMSSSTSPTRLLVQPSLQMLARSTSVVTAKAYADKAFDMLDGFVGVLSGTTYIQIVADQVPFQADRDAEQRFIYSVNFTVWKTT